MEQHNIALEQGASKFIFADYDTDLGQVISDALTLLQRFPEIEHMVFHDQEARGENKKRDRIGYEEWKKARTSELPEWEPPEEGASTRPVRLERTGCPRMPPKMVYVFSVLRGYLSSMAAAAAVNRVRDSRAVETYLAQTGQSLPRFRTILDNINTVSQDTLNYILDCQLKMTLEEDLDDFSEQMLDSTSVQANSQWPTDASVIYRLIERACRIGGKLDVLDLPRFTDKRVLNHWLPKMKKLVFRINTVGGKPGSKGKRKKYYNQLLKRTVSSLERLVPHAKMLKEELDALDLPPRQKRRAEEYVDRVINDLHSACRMHQQCEERVFNNKHTRARDKVLSLSDETAAFIKKGDREPVIGYKVQLARSAKGFVCAVTVPEGNTADSEECVPLVEQSIQRTQVTPCGVTADDGYSSTANRKSLTGMDVENVRFCGSKGKKITPRAEWDSEQHRAARNNRSAVESLMYVLKHGFDFGHAHRRGIDRVRCEVLEKVIAYNFCRLALVRERKKRREEQAKLKNRQAA